jgi:hypothetical protein
MPVDPGRAAALESAQEILQHRYPAASAAFVAGSLVRGLGDALSDVDLVVVFDSLHNAYRESFMWGDTPVEAFVHDPATLRWFLRDDVRKGVPVMIDMVLDSHTIGPDVSVCQPIRAYAENLRHAGPPPLDRRAMAALRYRITDLLDDLRADRPPAEVLAIACALYEPAAELFLRGRGRWSARGKWIPRCLQHLDPEVGGRFEDSFRALFTRNDGSYVIALLSEELASHGGPLFAGDHREAQPDWRLAD